MSPFARMLREEYRLHASLFGGPRFLAFPVFIAAIVGGGAWLLGATGVETGAIVAGVHALLAFFGLQVGTIGLVGRDAMRDVLGDVTLLVFSARTLPLSWRHLLATFLLKDLVYYVALFVTPIVVGLAPLVAGDGALGLLWLTAAGIFAFGAAVSLTLVGLATRSRVLLVVVVAAATATYLAGVDPVAYTPYAAYLDPTPVSALRAFVPTIALALAAPLLFEPGAESSRQVRRVNPDTFGRLRRRLGNDPAAGLRVRPLLEVARSSGSVWKIAFSLGILFTVAIFLLDRVMAATALRPNPGIALGILLGLGSFTTYNWVTTNDDPREYLRYPVGYAAVFAGKRGAYLLLTLPTGLAYLALGAVWYPPADLAIGVLVFPPVAVYVFGLTAYLTGLSPNELLFDTPLFVLFGLGLATVAVPILVLALAGGEYPTVGPVLAVAIALVSGLVGIGLSRRSGPRWHARLRSSS